MVNDDDLLIEKPSSDWIVHGTMFLVFVSAVGNVSADLPG